MWKLVSRASQWLPMLRGIDELLEFSSFLFSHYGDQSRPHAVLTGLMECCSWKTYGVLKGFSVNTLSKKDPSCSGLNVLGMMT
jgi:hypothetical protein